MNRARGIALVAVVLVLLVPVAALAQQFPFQFGDEGEISGGNIATGVKLALLMSALSLLPSMVIMMTSFTRIVIVFSFLRQAMSTPSMPPNQVLLGLALFLTAFVMMPVWTEINSTAIQPLVDGEITELEALDRGIQPMRGFMLAQTREKDLMLFTRTSGIPRPEDEDDIPLSVVLPSFMLSEIKTAFQIGFVLYIPFIVVDLVIASVLMSMGMMMLPPAMISLPFKILLFILVDGWHLIVRSVVESFR